LKFFGRYGNWSDIGRILSLFEKAKSALSLWDEIPKRTTLLVASTLYAMARGRLVDLLGLKIDSALRRYLVCSITRKDIQNLDDETLVSELNNEDESVRKAAALRIVQSCTAHRVRTILGKYLLAGERYYYNAAHWLDLGASIPVCRSKRRERWG
jgi:hypothetical protein